jgi:trehalose-phosphatase
MRHAMNAIGAIRRRLQGRPKLLILDFDGTLAAISRRPETVCLDERTGRSLAAMASSNSTFIAIVSGRSLKDLRHRFRVRGAHLFGNHGLEAGGFRLPARARRAKKLAVLLWLIKEKLEDALARVPGVSVEDKGLTLSVHFRNMPSRASDAFRAAFSQVKKACDRWPVVWKRGKKVWECRPRVRWDKGDAARFISARYRGALPIILGDDVSDEDMFRKMRKRGITIRVGRSKRSDAEYYLRSPGEVRRFLAALSDES